MLAKLGIHQSQVDRGELPGTIKLRPSSYFTVGTEWPPLSTGKDILSEDVGCVDVSDHTAQILGQASESLLTAQTETQYSLQMRETSGGDSAAVSAEKEQEETELLSS